MNYSLREWILYIILRSVSRLLLFFPPGAVVFLGKVLGTIAFYIDKRHKKIAYKNLRFAFAGQRDIPELKRILKKNFQNFGMNLVEILTIPRVNRDYVDRYIEIEGKENLRSALRQKKGAILLGIHMGNWEICFAVAGILGMPLYILVEEQARNPLLDKYLNQIRQSKGVGILRIGSQMRKVIEVIKENKIIGLVVDHGIKEGVPVDFFGHKTLTPTGAVRLALSLDVPILLAYIRRTATNRHKAVISPIFNLKKSSDLDKDIIDNLTTINRMIEGYIRRYPAEYLWFYKRFKYILDREVLVLSDGKAGHTRQIETCLRLLKEIGKEKKLDIRVKQVNVDFKSKLHRNLQLASVSLAGRSTCQGCLWCLKNFLSPESFSQLQSSFADIVISCGSSLVGVNFVISSENQARSIVIMRPGHLSTNRFDLAVMPRHDNPPRRKNVIVTEGALSPVDEKYLKEQSDKLMQSSVISATNIGASAKYFGGSHQSSAFYIGLLIGGDTKDFHLKKEILSDVIKQIKSVADKNNADVLVTTSRRTAKDAEELAREEFCDYPRCKLLVIANEKNYPFVVGGILGLSRMVLVSPESISMVSEAASSGRYVMVFAQNEGLGKRHKRFLAHLSKNGYIYLKEPTQIQDALEEIICKRPAIRTLDDLSKVRQALEKIL